MDGLLDSVFLFVLTLGDFSDLFITSIYEGFFYISVLKLKIHDGIFLVLHDIQVPRVLNQSQACDNSR